MVSTIHAAIQKSPFKNVYWFSRWLLNTDQFGALGKQKEARMLELVAVLENLSAQENFSDDEKFRLMKNILLTEIPNMTTRGQRRARIGERKVCIQCVCPASIQYPQFVMSRDVNENFS